MGSVSTDIDDINAVPSEKQSNRSDKGSWTLEPVSNLGWVHAVFSRPLHGIWWNTAIKVSRWIARQSHCNSIGKNRVDVVLFGPHLIYFPSTHTLSEGQKASALEKQSKVVKIGLCQPYRFLRDRGDSIGVVPGVFFLWHPDGWERCVNGPLLY